MITANTLTASGLITANAGIGTTTLTASGLITANTLTASGLITANNGLTVTGTTNINTTGSSSTSIGNTGTTTITGTTVAVNGATNINGYVDITSGGLEVSGGLTSKDATTCTGILTANGGITATAGIGTTTLTASGLITANTLTASGLITANNGLTVTGATTITGATNINNTGSSSTNIGNLTGATNFTGNVGIGTSPQYPLDISGNLQVTSGSSNLFPSAIIEKRPGDYSDFASVWQHQAQLQIQNQASSISPFSPNTMVLAMSDDGVGIIQGATNSGNYNNICLNPFNPFTYPNDARVGIGTFEPGCTLDVSGNIQTSNSLLLINDGYGSSIFQLGSALTIQNGNTPAGYIYINAFNQEGIIVYPNSVGINGAALNASYALNVTGAVNATSYNSASDYRIKKDVVTLDETFTVDKLRPVTYNNTKLDKQDIGLIAHELQEVYPFLVNGEKDGENFQSVNYTGLIGILIKEIQELKERVKKLEEK